MQRAWCIYVATGCSAPPQRAVALAIEKLWVQLLHHLCLWLRRRKLVSLWCVMHHLLLCGPNYLTRLSSNDGQIVDCIFHFSCSSLPSLLTFDPVKNHVFYSSVQSQLLRNDIQSLSTELNSFQLNTNQLSNKSNQTLEYSIISSNHLPVLSNGVIPVSSYPNARYDLEVREQYSSQNMGQKG